MAKNNNCYIFATLIFDLSLGNATLTTPPSRVSLYFVNCYLPRSTYVPNLKCLDSSVPEIGGWVTHPLWETYLSLASIYHDLCSLHTKFQISVFTGSRDRRESEV